MTLTQPPILCVVDLTVPEFVCVVNYAHFALKLVDCEELNNFDLDVKVIKSVWVFRRGHRNFRHFG